MDMRKFAKFQKDLQADEDALVRNHQRQIESMADSMRMQLQQLVAKDEMIKQLGDKLGDVGQIIEAIKKCTADARKDHSEAYGISTADMEYNEKMILESYLEDIEYILKKIEGGDRGNSQGERG